METRGAAQGAARDGFIVTKAERQVADLLPIEVDPALARAKQHRRAATADVTNAEREADPAGGTAVRRAGLVDARGGVESRKERWPIGAVPRRSGHVDVALA